MKKLGLINYEGDCLSAIKKGDNIIIRDQHGKDLETTNVKGLCEFIDGYRDITDSEGKLCNLLVMPVSDSPGYLFFIVEYSDSVWYYKCRED